MALLCVKLVNKLLVISSADEGLILKMAIIGIDIFTTPTDRYK